MGGATDTRGGWWGEDATDGVTRKEFEDTVCLRVKGNNCDVRSNG